MKKRPAKRKVTERKSAVAETPPVAAERPKFRFTHEMLARLGPAKPRRKAGAPAPQPFEIPKPPPGVLPKGQRLAFDEALTDVNAWAANGYILSAFAEGTTWLGYQELAILAQRTEYRRISERIAGEMVRKWIELESVGDENKAKQKERAEKIKKLNDAMARLQVRDRFREAAEQDGFFGRSHIYLDTGSIDDSEELQKPIGDGSNTLSKAKVSPDNPIKGLRCIEPMWTYPATYEATDPLKPSWYKPASWFVMGKQVHGSRLLTFIGREVPDILKPVYSFGGLSLTQMAKPYVDYWLKDRSSVSDIIAAFSVFVLLTDLVSLMQPGGDDLINRIDAFNRLRDNAGVMALNKESEDFKNVSAPLGTLDALQAQAQEHICSAVGMPLVIYTGISPAGLNASSEGEIRVWYDWINSYQEMLFRKNLTRVVNFLQLSEFGEIDPGITIKFVPLWSMDERGEAEVEKIEAETDQINIDSGVISQLEARRRIASKPGSAYASLDVDDLPEPPPEELEEFGKAVEAIGKGENAEAGSESAGEQEPRLAA